MLIVTVFFLYDTFHSKVLSTQLSFARGSGEKDVLPYGSTSVLTEYVEQPGNLRAPCRVFPA